MSTDSIVRWLSVYRIYLVIATILCVISPLGYVFNAGFFDLSSLGTSVVRIIIFASAAATASRITESSIRSFHLSLNAAGAVFGLLYLLMQFSIFGYLPLISQIGQTVGGFVVVPWSFLIPIFGYQFYALTTIFGLVAASIWTFLLATYDPATQPVAVDRSIGPSADHGIDHQHPDHRIQAARTRNPWRPLLISFLFGLAINLVPVFVITYDNQDYGWLLYFITVPVGGFVLLIGLIWSIVLVSNNH